MQAEYMDYIIADAFVIPPQYANHYSEKIIYLPDCFQANDDKRISSETLPRTAYGLPERGIVFCSFNNSYKITPEFFGVWMRLLKAVSGSVLWLVGNEAVEANLRAEAAGRGIDPARLIFADKMPYQKHLARLQHADLFLDTLPFNAGTTASDALWAGVPLITCAGEAFASRMAGGLLTALNLPELITEKFADYEKLALALATDPVRLAAIKSKLSENRDKSPLFDTSRFTRNLEAAYIKIGERTQAGFSPDHIH
jgi:predicted O-linked N-acetylglucosamine transferase (SPINDLY family)